MTETPVREEPAELRSLLEQWVQSPPPSLSDALDRVGLDADALEQYARSGISTEELETLRRVLVQGAAGENPQDAELLRRLTPALDPRQRAWERVERARETGEILTAIVTEATKGGVVVDLGVRGFIPASQLGLSVPRNLQQYVGRSLRMRVIEIDRKRQTVVLSNRQVLEEERAQKRRSAMERIQEGQELTGTVRRLTDIGAFVDVGGVDGLLHVSEIAWKRVEHPSDVLKVGQRVPVKVLRVDPAAGRISLSMRKLTEDPWDDIRRKYMPGMTMKVTVSQVVPQGAVVSIDGQQEGFIPVSELAQRRVASPDEVVQVGQELEALILELQHRDRRVVLSLKKMEQRKERQEIDSFQRKQTVTRRSERTTLGDLFGHLFEGYQASDGEAAGPEEAAPVGEAVAPQDEHVGEAVAPQDEHVESAVEQAGADEEIEGVGDETLHEAAESPVEQVPAEAEDRADADAPSPDAAGEAIGSEDRP